MTWVSKDGIILLTTRGFRTFGYGYLGIIIAIYLQELGFDPLKIGFLLSASIIGGASFTIIMGRYAIHYGLKKMLLLSVFFSAVGTLIFIVTENIILLFFASLIGFLSPSARELGPFLSLEQAYLPTTVANTRRTRIFSIWNVIANLAGAIGALFGSLPYFFQKYFLIEKILSFKIMFIIFFLIDIIVFLFYLNLKEVTYSKTKDIEKLSNEGKNVIIRLSTLFALDSFAGGLIITSIVSWWFSNKFGLTLDIVGVTFFIAGILQTLSLYAAGILGERIGLINTMVFTHIPSSIFLIIIPFMPTFQLAALFYFLRQSLSQMDVPTRESYITGVIKDDEKSRATSITSATRNFSASVSPSISAPILFAVSIINPFVISGTLKVFYDILVYYNFRHLRTPEEQIASSNKVNETI